MPANIANNTKESNRDIKKKKKKKWREMTNILSPQKIRYLKIERKKGRKKEKILIFVAIDSSIKIIFISETKT